jgi:N6-adenosine-specific RNA methylase IME4
VNISQPLPDKLYNIIYADPPWFQPPRNPSKKFGKGVQNHYPVMKDRDILSMPVPTIAAENCALLLWVTCPRLDLGVATVKAWGFRYCTVAFVWIKENPVSGGLFSGVGHYTKSNAEFVLLGVKGSMPSADLTVKQPLIAARSVHSRKPIEIRQRIERLFGDVPRIELFARERFQGWDAWGNDTEHFAEQQESQLTFEQE